MKRNFVNLKNARKGEYGKVIEKISRTGQCPFCKENFKYHKKPVYKKKGSWFLTDNSWPYKNTAQHLMILCEEHKENFSDLSQKDLEAVKYLANWAIKEFKIKGGALAIRFGDTNYTGATVSHLHFHLISPKKDRSVNFPIG